MGKHLVWVALVVGCVGACGNKDEPKKDQPASGSSSVSGSAAAAPAKGSAATAGLTAAAISLSAAAPAPAFKVGDPVYGLWSNDEWYPGKIGAVNADGTFRVNYNDGDVSKSLSLKRVKARKPSAASTGGGGHGGGASTGDAPCPGPGITRRCGGVCVNIQEDDNNCGGCGDVCPDGKHCDGHLFCRDADGNL